MTNKPRKKEKRLERIKRLAEQLGDELNVLQAVLPFPTYGELDFVLRTLVELKGYLSGLPSVLADAPLPVSKAPADQWPREAHQSGYELARAIAQLHVAILKSPTHVAKASRRNVKQSKPKTATTIRLK